VKNIVSVEKYAFDDKPILCYTLLHQAVTAGQPVLVDVVRKEGTRS